MAVSAISGTNREVMFELGNTLILAGLEERKGQPYDIPGACSRVLYAAIARYPCRVRWDTGTSGLPRNLWTFFPADLRKIQRAKVYTNFNNLTGRNSKTEGGQAENL